MKSNIVSFASRARAVFNVGRNRVAALGTALTGMALSGAASAQGLGADALAEVSGVRADVAAILAVLVGVVFLLVAWSYFKRAK
ncbi:hypothetical protein G9274_001874 [Stenotrophomonas rhizophila]|nr:hypothetical protein G9274_001874 [Stenotrophomonas rhizophila]